MAGGGATFPPAPFSPYCSLSARHRGTLADVEHLPSSGQPWRAFLCRGLRVVEMSNRRKEVLEYDIGKRLKEIRAERKLTIAKVSTETGIHETYLSRLENNRRRASIKVLEKLAPCYNVKLHEFFQRPKRRPPKSLEAHLKGLSKAKKQPIIRSMQKVFHDNTKALALLKKLDRK